MNQAEQLHTEQRILVLTSSSTGNNVFCTPAIRLIRKHRPHCLLDVVALSALSAEIFEDNPDINHLYVLDSTREMDAIARKYDVVFCLNVNSSRRLKGLKTPMLIAPQFVGGRARADQLLDFVAGLLACEIEPSDRQYVMGVPTTSTLLDGYSINQKDILIHLHLGLGRTALHGWKFFYRKRANADIRLWPIEDYIALGLALVTSNPNIRIVITGTKNESYLAKKFCKQVPRSINLAGLTSASDIYNMMRKIDLFIAHDCGVFHIASATQVPILGLYAPTDPIVAGPFPVRPQHTLIKKALMTDIRPQEVAAHAQYMLAQFCTKWSA